MRHQSADQIVKARVGKFPAAEPWKPTPARKSMNRLRFPAVGQTDLPARCIKRQRSAHPPDKPRAARCRRVTRDTNPKRRFRCEPDQAL